jgi:hypothetical protein
MSHLEDALPEVELYGLEELTAKLREGGGRAVVARASLTIVRKCRNSEVFVIF